MSAPAAELCSPESSPEPEARRVGRWASALVLLPLPLWFAFCVLRDPGPVWRAEYHGSSDLSGPEVLIRERRLSRYWDRQEQSVPGDFAVSEFSVRFDSCLSLREAQEIPFQLVATGAARFWIDQKEQLSVEPSRERTTRGAVLSLGSGMHHLRVEFSGRGWPSIALNASFDGHAPVAVPPELRIPGVVWSAPRSGPEPCPPK